MSDESLDPALTAHSHTPRHCRVSRHYFTRLVVTHTRSSHIQSTAVARPRDTTAASWTSRHPTVSRPRARLPTYLLLASYGAIGRSAPRPGPAPRPLARSPDQPAGAPPRGRARVRRPYYTLVVTRGFTFSLYRIGLYVYIHYYNYEIVKIDRGDTILSKPRTTARSLGPGRRLPPPAPGPALH